MTRQPTISTDSVAQDQIRAFVERILRMKEEAKAIKDDIREIYAEADRLGIDKTDLGIRVRLARQEAEGLRVYFIAFRKAGLLKIGISRKVGKRLARLSADVGERGELINSFPGVFAIEGWTHASFNPWRVKGEWFRLCADSEALARAAINPTKGAE
jgi:uncharacterized protein (UPF0335 family)